MGTREKEAERRKKSQKLEELEGRKCKSWSA